VGATLGIIAGGGDLPRVVAESARDSGRPVFVLALGDFAGNWITRFNHEVIAYGEFKKALNALRGADCGDVIMLGKVERPNFSAVKVDSKALLALPKVTAAALKGDDALLRFFVDFFESEGFHPISVIEAAPALVAGVGLIGRFSPSAEDDADIAAALKVVRALGAVDVGQGAVVCAGLTLAVEAAEGTDAMLTRIPDLRETIRGTPAKRRGVLVKALKPTQDKKTDLPVIGVTTVENAAAAGLSGIAIEAGAALVMDRKAVAETANRHGLFVMGFAA
jgi:DUF1009 family protein